MHTLFRIATLSREEGAIEWEKSSLQVLSLSWIFDLVGVFVRVDTVYKCVLVILTIGNPLFKLFSGVRSLLWTGLEVYSSTALIRSTWTDFNGRKSQWLFWAWYTSLNGKVIMEASAVSLYSWVQTRISQVNRFNARK